MANRGRPSKYSEELADQICEMTANSSKGLDTICESLGISRQTAVNWFDEHPDFFVKYTRAKKSQAYFLAEEIVKISDDAQNDILQTEMGSQANHAAVQRARLQVDTRKWVASKLLPKVFGDKIDVTSDGNELKTKEVFVIGGKEFTFDK